MDKTLEERIFRIECKMDLEIPPREWLDGKVIPVRDALKTDMFRAKRLLVSCYGDVNEAIKRGQRRV